MSTAADPRPWLIYGAYGYTGRLLVDEAVRRGHTPVLAGRDPERLREVAGPHRLATRVFGLDDGDIAQGVAGVSLVLNAAGPMVDTAPALAAAAVAAGAHYVDVTAEPAALEAVAALDEAARAAGVTLLPAAGYDVIPSDCLARHVTTRLPDPRALEIGIWALPQPSRGTLRTVADMLRRGGLRRRGGELQRCRVGPGMRRLAFPPGRRWALAVPWGDLITAHHSTGVPDITTYLALRPRDVALALVVGPLGPRMFRWPWAVRAFELALSLGRPGPDAAVRATGRGWFWARATDADGHRHEAWLETPEGYRFTQLAAVRVVEGVLAGGAPTGFTTPAAAFGAELIAAIPGCRIIEPAATGGARRTSAAGA